MGIHPIDLQTLYSQMEKVGRQQGAEQQLTSTIRDAQQDQNKLDAQRKLSTVQGIEQSEDEKLKINNKILETYFSKDKFKNKCPGFFIQHIFSNSFKEKRIKN